MFSEGYLYTRLKIAWMNVSFTLVEEYQLEAIATLSKTCLYLRQKILILFLLRHRVNKANISPNLLKLGLLLEILCELKCSKLPAVLSRYA